VRARLVDLILGEADDAETFRAEVRSCAGCGAEYRALAETLRAFDRAAEEARPPEEFWPRYHARLASRLAAEEPGATRAPAARANARPSSRGFSSSSTRARSSSVAALMRRALTARWSVPAPAAVAALLLLVCLTPLALRRAPVVLAPPSQVDAPAPAASDPQPPRTIEVPVVREKIVTRTIYVTRPARAKQRTPPVEDARLAVVPNEGNAPARATLNGFRPAGDVKLRVIKESFKDER
jgi:hypothetical protein